MKYLKIIGIVIILELIGFKLCSCKEPMFPIDIVERICSREFNAGVATGERMDWVIYSEKREKLEKATDPQFANKVIFPDASNIIVVSTYVLQSYQIYSSSSVVYVLYDRLATSIGEGVDNRKFKEDVRLQDKVQYKLVYKDNAWHVIDPPRARIGAEAVIGVLSEKANLIKNTRPKTKEWCEREIQTLSKAKIDMQNKKILDNYKRK